MIKAAIDEPFSERQWWDFLTSCSWFMDQENVLRDQVELYRDTGRLADSPHRSTRAAQPLRLASRTGNRLRRTAERVPKKPFHRARDSKHARN